MCINVRTMKKWIYKCFVRAITASAILLYCLSPVQSEEQIYKIGRFLRNLSKGHKITKVREYVSRDRIFSYNAQDKLFLFVCLGDLDMVKNLLSEGVNPNFYYRIDGSYTTPLIEAIMRKDKSMVSLLIRNGAKGYVEEAPELEDPYDTPAMHLFWDYFDFIDICGIDESTIKMMGDINSRDKVGNTPIHYALRTAIEPVMEGRAIAVPLEKVGKLIFLGADVNLVDSNGYAPIFYATYMYADAQSRGEKLESLRWNLLIELLKVNGATITNKVGNSYTLDDIVYLSNPQVSKNASIPKSVISLSKIMQLCSDKNFSEEEAWLHIKNLDDINKKDHIGMTLLMRAILCNNLKMVQILLQAGASPHVPSATSFNWLKERSSFYSSKMRTPLEYVVQLREYYQLPRFEELNKEILYCLYRYCNNKLQEQCGYIIRSDISTWNILFENKDFRKNIPITVLCRLLKNNDCFCFHKESLDEFYHFFYTDCGRCVNERTDIGETLLLFILKNCSSFNPNVLDCMLSEVDVNAKDAMGCSAIMYARNVEQLKKIMDRGGESSITDVNGNNILHHCCMNAENIYELHSMLKLIKNKKQLSQKKNTSNLLPVDLLRKRFKEYSIERIIEGMFDLHDNGNAFETYFTSLCDLLSSE